MPESHAPGICLLAQPFATWLHHNTATFARMKGRGHLTARYRRVARIMLVAALAMIVHLAVPHHHHARHVALVCLQAHPGEASPSHPHCIGSEPGCQAGDAADCQPCDPSGQGALRPAHSLPHAGGTARPSTHFPNVFLPAPHPTCPSRLPAGKGSRKCGIPCSYGLPEAPHGLFFGRRGPPCGC